MTQQALISEIQEILWALNADIEAVKRSDWMNYTGYLAENAKDLHKLVNQLTGE